MLFYYDCYSRGDTGYSFAGHRWPQEIDPEKNNEKGLDLLWNICTNIYGDNAPIEQRSESHFLIRGLFGGAVTVAGIAGPEFDSHGRIGTRVDLVFCLPQTEKERMAELDPQRLFELISKKNAAGTQQSMPAAQWCITRGGPAPVEWAPILYAMAFAKARLLVFNAANPSIVAQTAMQICAALPASRRLQFSFITYAVDLIRIQDAGFCVTAVSQPADCQREIYHLEQQGKGVWVGLDLQSSSYCCTRQPPAAGEDYLRRVHPILLRHGRQSLSDRCGSWFLQTTAKYCTGMKPVTAIAAGMMLQAARGETQELLPILQEKQEVFDAVARCLKP